MKSLATYVFSSVVCMVTAITVFGQETIVVVREDAASAVSLGDPVAVLQTAPNIVQVNHQSCSGCAAKLDFQACCEPAKGCGGCKETVVSVACTSCNSAPSCACAAKPTPCKACEVHKHFRHAPAPCATCAAPAPCKTCSAPAPCAAPVPAPCAAPVPAPCAAPVPAPCKTCAAPAPCNACETKKIFHHHAPAATPCTTCTAPAAAPCKTCAAPAPAPCNACETKKIFHHHAPAACTTCAAPAPAPCATCAKPVPCTACPAPAPCKVAAQPCTTGCQKPACACDACQSHGHTAAQSRPILDGLKRWFAGSGHHHAPAAAPCSTCAAQQAAPTTTAQQIPVSVPTTLPAQPVSYETRQNAPVPASLAPYSGQFSTAVPAAEMR